MESITDLEAPYAIEPDSPEKLLEKKPPLVILPSPLIMAVNYRNVARALSPFFQIYLPELPATGWNQSLKRVWSIRDYAQWLANYLDQKKLQDAIILGHSNSGAIAITLAALHPDRVRGLILVDTIGIKKQPPTRMLAGRLQDMVLETRFSLRASPNLLFNLFRHTRNFIAQLRSSYEADVSELIPRIKSPTLVIWGEKDHTTPADLTSKIRDLLPEAELWISPRGSHDCLLTEFQNLSTTLGAWGQGLTNKYTDQKTPAPEVPAGSHPG